MKYTYNIHNVLKIKSDIKLSLNNSFTPTLDCFLTNKDIKEKDADLLIKCKKIKKEGNYNKIADGLFYSSDQASLFSRLKFSNISLCWQVKNLLNQTTQLEFNRIYHIFSKFVKIPISSVYPLCLLIRNILQFKLLLKQGTFLVGSSIVVKDKCFIFTGAYGCGKTTILLDMMKEKGVSFLSDDLMLLHNNYLYGLPSLIIYRKHNFGLFSSHGHINPLQVFNKKITSFFKGKECEVYFLEKSSRPSIKQIPVSKGIIKIQNVNNIIHSYFSERVLSYVPFIYNDYSILSSQRKQLEILSNFFKNSKFYVLRSDSLHSHKNLLRDRVLI